MPNLYRDTAEPAAVTPPLDGDIRADVAVVGAGFTGLSTALHLAEQGAKVVVLEAEEPGWGASGRNGGQVNPGLKHDPDTVERDFGPDLGGRMNALAGAAPQFVFDLIRRHGIACEARQNGTLRAAVAPKHAAAVRVTAEQLQRRQAPVECLSGKALADMTGTDRYQVALFDPRGGDVNPLSYARGLARAAMAAGATVHGGTRALSLRQAGSANAVSLGAGAGVGAGGSGNATWQVATPSGSVIAQRVVLATNGYTDDLWPSLRRSVVPVFGAIAATEPLPDRLARAVMPSRAVLYESGAITVYYRVDGGGRLLIGGRGPQTEISSTAPLSHLLSYAHKLWPALGDIEWTHAWGGRLAMTQDSYSHWHEPAKGVIACVAYNGRGVAMATTMGALIAKRILDPAARCDMPITDLKPIALHGLWPLAVRGAILRGRVSDFLGL